MASTDNAAPGAAQRRDLRAIVADGVFFSVMVGLGETYLPAFVLAAGLSDVVASLIATLPMLAGGAFQLITPWAVRYLRSYRRWVVLCASLQALSFVPLVVASVRGELPLTWLASSTIAYWTFGMATGPAWNTWVTSLVPEAIRPRFFANRNRMAQAALFLAILGGGLLLQWGRTRGAEVGVFGVIFAVAIAMRLVSAAFLARQSETPGLTSSLRMLTPGAIAATIRAAGSARVLAYLIVMQIAVNVAAPLFTPFLLGPLALSYSEFMALTAASFLARVAILPLFGHLAHARGTRALLWFGAVGIVPLPLLWLVSANFFYLLAVQVLAGIAWAALELATLLSFFEGIEERSRTSVLSAFNLLNAAAIALGAVIGSQLFLTFGGTPGAWTAVFAASVLARFSVLFLLRGTGPNGRGVGLSLRTLAVRPAGGDVARPILASIHESQSSSTASGTPSEPAA